MDDPQLGRLEELFHAASGLSGPALDEFLDRRCEPELRQRLLGLLEQARDDPGFLETPPFLPPDAEGDGCIGVRIGRFRTLSVLGAGTMGTVYRAEQDTPHREVAVKILPAWGESADAVRRFHDEAEYLGRLRHPGIARILEAGVAEMGGIPRRYIAMELVEGEPLTAHAGRLGLSRRERVELLARVCDAMEHAHRRGVVHRDLKPANILVEPGEDRVGQPRVLDFGVARAADGAGSATLDGRIIGTPAYMSPEQARAELDAVTERSDVYSLGALLFELLTGRPPLVTDGMSQAQALHLAADAEAPSLASLDRSLRGELDAIAARALARQPRHRYASAGELGDDLRRHLNHEPVAARPPGRVARLFKHMRRRPLLWGAASSIVGALALTAAGTSIGMLRAQREATRAQRIVGFLESAITAADPFSTGGDRTALALVRDMARRAHSELSADPDAQATTLIAAARSLLALGVPQEAETEARASLDIAARPGARSWGQQAAAAAVLAQALNEQGRYGEALDVVDRTEGQLGDRLGAEEPMLRLTVQRGIALLNSPGQPGTAVELLRSALAAARRTQGPGSPIVRELTDRVAWALFEAERCKEAEPIYRALLQDAREHAGGTGRALLAQRSLAAALWHLDRLEEAESECAAALSGIEGLAGPGHPQTLIAVNIMGTIAEGRGDLRRAEALYERAVRGREASDPRSPPARYAMVNLTRVRLALAMISPAEALPALEDALRLAQESPRPTQRSRLRLSYARCLLLLGRVSEAEPYIRGACEQLRGALPPGHRWRVEAESMLAQIGESKRPRQ